jgi:hypothetical protein
MNWGKSIILAFVLFTIFIGTLVVICMKQEISLVSKNYYQEELRFQQHINKLNNTEQLKDKPSIQLIPHALKIAYTNFQNVNDATLTIFCPANAANDKLFNIDNSDENTVLIPTSTIAPGMYKARFNWMEDGKEFFIEEIIHI